MITPFNNTITTSKRLYLALWPGEDYTPEVWTYEDVEADFGTSDEVMSYVAALEEGESLQETDSNLILVRIPPNISTQGLMAQLGVTVRG